MGNNGLYKLYGASYTRIQPALCGFCKHYHANINDAGWDKCDAKNKLLSNPHVIEGKCKDFNHGGQRVPDETIASWKQDAQEYQDMRLRRKAKGTLLDRVIKSVESSQRKAEG